MAITPSDTEVVDDFPAAGTQTVEVEFVNRGEGTATLGETDLVANEGSAGTFELIGAPSKGTELDVEESVTVEVEFHPDTDSPEGCGFAAQAEIVLNWSSSEGGALPARATVWFGGECDSDLRCKPTHLNFEDALVGRSTSEKFECRNISDEARTFSGATVESDDAQAFDVDLGFESGAELSAGQSFMTTVEVRPNDEGTTEATVILTTAGGSDPFEVAVTVEATGVFPMCSSGSAPTAQIPTEMDGYSFEMESTNIHSYVGEVVDSSNVSESSAPMLNKAILIADGSFLHEYCNVSNSGATVSWEGVQCEEGPGTLSNVMPVALNDDVEEHIQLIQLGDRVQFDGYDIDRVVRESWWSDGNQSGDAANRSMFVTRICHP